MFLMRFPTHFFQSNWRFLLGGLLIFVASVSVTYAVLSWRAPVVESQPTVPRGSAVPPPSLPPVEEIKNLGVVLLGYGGPGHQGGFLTDVILLLYIDIERSVVALVSIPRDLWVTYPAGGATQSGKINALFAQTFSESDYPRENLEETEVTTGAYALKQAITAATNLPVTFFVGVDFNSFPKVVDSLGGITVDVPKTFDDYFYPVKGLELELCGKTPEEVTNLSATMSGFTLEKQFPCRYEHLHFDAGVTEMDGETALKFVRSRHSNQHGGDFARAERQHVLLTGIKDALLTVKALDDAGAFFGQMAGSIHTDLSLDFLEAIVPILKRATDFRIVSISLNDTNVLQSGTSSNGQFILIPKAGADNWQATHEFIQQELGRD